MAINEDGNMQLQLGPLSGGGQIPISHITASATAAQATANTALSEANGAAVAAANAQTEANGATVAAAAAQVTADTALAAANADNLIAEVTIAVQTDTITILGLDGQTDGGYEFEYTGLGLPGFFNCRPNGIVPDGSGTDFDTVENGAAVPYWLAGNGKGISQGRINARTGGFRMFTALTTPLNDDGSLVTDARPLIGVWTNTAINVTSLVFIHQSANGFQPGCRLSVRRISK